MGNFLIKPINSCVLCCCGKDVINNYKWEDKIIKIEDDIWNKNVKDCFIKSAHNSFLDNKQIFDTASLDILKETLNEGYRMIEFDIFKHPDKRYKNLPIIAHGNGSLGIIGTGYLHLEDALNIIKDFAWKNTDLPLFISIDLNIVEQSDFIYSDNKLDSKLLKKYSENELDCYKQIINLIENILLDKIYISEHPNIFAYTPLRYLKNKLILLSSKTVPDILRPYIPFELNTHYFKNISHKYLLDSVEKNLEDVVENKMQMISKWGQNHLIRIYPSNKIISFNYDTLLYLRLGCQFVSINKQYKDSYYKQYEQFFNGFSIVSKNKLIHDS